MKKTNLILIFTLLLSGILLNSCKKDDDDDTENVENQDNPGNSDTTDLATVITMEITNININSAIAGGEITDDGGSAVTARGVCYSTNQNPSIIDNVINDGSGNGSFSINLLNLSDNLTYYVRAFATNSNGTAYGEEVNFTTQTISGGGGTLQKVWVPGGSFDMGSMDGGLSERPVHTVTLDGFYISKYEVTNQQFADYMNEAGVDSNGMLNGTKIINLASADCQIEFINGSFLVKTGFVNYPVMEVRWKGAKYFSEFYGGRLPTEAEWEFAARGGNSGLGFTYSGSDVVLNVAWYQDNSDDIGNSNFSNGAGHGTLPIGIKTSNELGIYDMSGNVYEWCNDNYDADYYSVSPSTNPQGPATGSKKVIRGGSWDAYATDCRVASRANMFYTNDINNIGFRPVFDTN